jgi:hypothetical protein
MALKVVSFLYRPAILTLMLWLSCCPNPKDFGS